MHLLHTKSWHTKSAANIAKVKRDEEEARLRQVELDNQALATDRQARLELLRSRTNATSAAPAVSKANYVNLPTPGIRPTSDDEFSAVDQLTENRLQLSEYRTAQGHFDFFPVPDSPKPKPSTNVKYSKPNPIQKADEHAFKLGGKPLDVPWYHQHTRRQAKPVSPKTRCDWQDPIYDMGIKNKRRVLPSSREPAHPPRSRPPHRNRSRSPVTSRKSRLRDRSRSRGSRPDKTSCTLSSASAMNNHPVRRTEVDKRQL